MQGALKLKEMAYIHAEGYSGGALKHGPFALIEGAEGSNGATPIILIILDDEHAHQVREIRTSDVQNKIVGGMFRVFCMYTPVVCGVATTSKAYAAFDEENGGKREWKQRSFADKGIFFFPPQQGPARVDRQLYISLGDQTLLLRTWCF